jgi:hypothetical protein
MHNFNIVNSIIIFDNYGNNIGSIMYRILLKSNIPNNKLTELTLIILWHEEDDEKEKQKKK